MDRYARQMRFSPIGLEGQKRIGSKHVLIIGVGALGSTSAEALVRAGVGKLTIIDGDVVETSNLQRQQLYAESDALQELPKVEAAVARLRAINSEVEIVPWVREAAPALMESLAQDADLIIDGTDNMEARFMINDISQKYRIPWIYGACIGSYGLTYTIIPGSTPCLVCLMDQMRIDHQTCDQIGIISPAVQLVTAYQVSEALKLLTENKGALRRELVSFDVWTNQHSFLRVEAMRRTDCPSCGFAAEHPYLTYPHQIRVEALCGGESYLIRPPRERFVQLQEVAMQFARSKGKVDVTPYLLRYTEDTYRAVIFTDGRAMLHGFEDAESAKRWYRNHLGY